jgi:hypothetical protein
MNIQNKLKVCVTDVQGMDPHIYCTDYAIPATLLSTKWILSFPYSMSVDWDEQNWKIVI